MTVFCPDDYLIFLLNLRPLATGCFKTCFIVDQYCVYVRGHGGRVVTLSPPTSEAGVRFPARPQVGKLVVACGQFTVQNPDKLHVLVSSSLPTTRRDMTSTVLKVT